MLNTTTNIMFKLFRIMYMNFPTTSSDQWDEVPKRIWKIVTCLMHNQTHVNWILFCGIIPYTTIFLQSSFLSTYIQLKSISPWPTSSPSYSFLYSSPLPPLINLCAEVFLSNLWGHLLTSTPFAISQDSATLDLVTVGDLLTTQPTRHPTHNCHRRREEYWNSSSSSYKTTVIIKKIDFFP